MQSHAQEKPVRKNIASAFRRTMIQSLLHGMGGRRVALNFKHLKFSLTRICQGKKGRQGLINPCASQCHGSLQGAWRSSWCSHEQARCPGIAAGSSRLGDTLGAQDFGTRVLPGSPGGIWEGRHRICQGSKYFCQGKYQ